MGGAVVMPDGLTPKERAFVDAFVGEAKGNASKAMRLAGYGGASAKGCAVEASRMLAKPNVSEAILVAAKAVSEQTQRATVASELEQREFLTRVLRGEETEPQLVRDGESVTIEEAPPKLADRLKASDQLAKRDGAYAADKAAGKQAAAAEKVASLLALAKGLKG